MLRDDDGISRYGDDATGQMKQAPTDERSIPFDERLAGSGNERLICRLFGTDFSYRPAGQIQPRLLARMRPIIERTKIRLRAIAPPEIKRGI